MAEDLLKQQKEAEDYKQQKEIKKRDKTVEKTKKVKEQEEKERKQAEKSERKVEKKLLVELCGECCEAWKEEPIKRKCVSVVNSALFSFMQSAFILAVTPVP